MGDMYDRILKLCAERGIKPGRVCTDTGLSRGLMSDLKKGRTKQLSAKNTRIIADYLGVSTDCLLGTENEKTPTQEGEREISEKDVKMAFFRGADIADDEMDELWEDARNYINYKLSQKRNKK